ncbi:MAG: nicotinamide-nucleotide amidohydrolase family protein [Pirellulaceae bacterium]
MVEANDFRNELEQAARELGAFLLESAQVPVVFAESCTGGLVAASLTCVPGISQFLCGSAVTYRAATKEQWLGISISMLEQFSAESMIVSESMALNVLERTPEAHWSASITGHLGPNAPEERDGIVFIAVARRIDAGCRLVISRQISLSASDRVERQYEAARIVLNATREAIAKTSLPLETSAEPVVG